MKKILASILFIILSITCMGCSLSSADSGETVDIENSRSEIDTLKEWFPDMQGIESAEWELVTVTTQGRMPGPSDYQIKGIIVLDEDVAERYWNQYECTEVTVDFDTEYADNIDKEP